MYIFDLDGTITDTNGLWVEVDNEFLSRRGLPATVEEIDTGAMPAGELIVRALEFPFGTQLDVLKAFTVAVELDGVVQPLLGRISVAITIECDQGFRLFRVDVTEDEQTGERIEEWVELEYTYEEGVLTFETDRDGLFLLVPAGAAQA